VSSKDRDGRKPREELGSWIMGKMAIRAVFAAHKRRPRKLFWTRGKEDDLIEFIKLAKDSGITTEEMPFSLITDKAGSENHQGVLLYADPIVPISAEQLIPKVGAPLLLLDHIEDPQNLGACLRTAAEMGAAAVILPRARSAPLSPTTLKAAAGAVEFLPLVVEANMAQVLERCRQNSWWAVGADPEAKQPAWQAAWQRPAIIVIGGEGKGLSSLVAKSCDELVRLPSHAGLTLNASVAAALLLYEAVRPQ
jgi:23S rRNA (guanosine2251-2'-O)-methyltransferase